MPESSKRKREDREREETEEREFKLRMQRVNKYFEDKASGQRELEEFLSRRPTDVSAQLTIPPLKPSPKPSKASNGGKSRKYLRKRKSKSRRRL